MKANGKMRVLVITLIGGIDVIGELEDDPTQVEWLKVWHPYLFQVQPPNICLKPILRGSPLIAGDYTMIKASSLLWVNEPAASILTTYRAARAGLVAPEKATVPAADIKTYLNQ